MTDGHTVDRPAVYQPMPSFLRLRGRWLCRSLSPGRVGRDKPRFAVFADEHHMRSDSAILAKKQRRSVEINRFKMAAAIHRPVAVLGAESPRLALPVARYEQDGAIKERYEAPVSVSGGNTFLLGPVKDRHSAESQAWT